MDGTKAAVNKLHQIVNILVGILIAITWLLIVGIATTKFLLLLSSQWLLVLFIFGSCCKMTVEAIIFLLVIHPFDVNHQCEVNGVQVHKQIELYAFNRCSKYMFPNMMHCVSNGGGRDEHLNDCFLEI